MLKKFLIAAVVMSLVACGESHTNNAPMATASSPWGAPVAQQQIPTNYPQVAPGQPIIINQPAPQQSSGMTDMLVGGAIGYMLGNSGNRSSVPVQPQVQTKIIERQVIREVPRTVPSPVVPSVTPNLTKAPVPATITRVDPPKVSTPSPSFSSRGFSGGSIGGRRR